MQIEGRVALVTGGSSGIGRATAELLARRGAKVIVHGRDPVRLEATASLIGGRALYGDLRDQGAASTVGARALAAHGRVDLLVANAGAGWSGRLTEIEPGDIDRLIAVNLTAPVHLVRYLLPGMVDRGSGHVVLVGSVAGRTGVAGEAVYAAAKAGLDVFAESLRLELGGTGVGVSLVLPGLVDTAFFTGRGGVPARRLPRPVQPEVVAGEVVRAVVDDRAEVWVPGWLRLAPLVRSLAPALFRRLSARFGEPVRIHAPGRGAR